MRNGNESLTACPAAHHPGDAAALSHIAGRRSAPPAVRRSTLPPAAAMFVFEKAKRDQVAKQDSEKLATFALQVAVIAGVLAALRAT